MRKTWVLLVLFSAIATVYPQAADSKVTRNSGFHKLSLEVELKKASYLPYEPLFVTFKLLNKTKTPLAADRPNFLNDSMLRVVNPRGELREVTSLTLTSAGGPLLPGPTPVLQPFQSYEGEEIPFISHEIFAEPGKYQIQFVLCGVDSNIVELKVERPKGINKEAFDFLSRHGKDVWFGSMFLKEDGLTLMEEFVASYGQSGYGDLAIYQLGNRYLHLGDLEKARDEFNKLRSSTNEFIATEAKQLLTEIGKKLKQTQP